MQRKEPAAAAGRTPGQRHQADLQRGNQYRHECQQCVGQLTTVLLLRDRGPRTTGPPGQAHEREQALQKQKDDISTMVKESFKAVYDLLRSDEAVQATFAPQLKEFEQVLSKLGSTATWIQDAQHTLKTIRTELHALLPRPHPEHAHGKDRPTR